MTLSNRAENTAVTMESMTRMPQGLACTRFADHTATYWKTPLRLDTATMTIIPASRPRVLKSMPRIAASWLRTPRTIIKPAPIRATMARLIFSETMTA